MAKACHAIMVILLMLAGEAVPLPFGSPALLVSTCSFVHSDIFQSYNVKFASFDPRRTPYRAMRRSPHQLISGRDRARTKVPHATLRGVEGAPRRVGPIFETAYCSHAYTRSPSTLDWHVRLFCDQDFHELAAQISLLQRHPSGPGRSQDSATGQSTAYVPPPRW